MPTVALPPREPVARWKTYVRSSSSASPTVQALIRSLDTFITTTPHIPSTSTSTSAAVVRRDQGSHETSRTGILVAVLVSVLGIFLIVALPLWFCRQPRHPPNQGSESKSSSPSLPSSPASVPPPAPPPTHNPGTAAHPAGGEKEPVPPPAPPPTHNPGVAARPDGREYIPVPPPAPPPTHDPGVATKPASGGNEPVPPSAPPPTHHPGVAAQPAGGENKPVPPPAPPPTDHPIVAANPASGEYIQVPPVGPSQGPNQHAGSQPTEGGQSPLSSTRPVRNPAGLAPIAEIPSDQKDFREPVAPGPVQNPQIDTQKPVSAAGHQVDGATFNGKDHESVASKRKIRSTKEAKGPHGRLEIQDKSNPGGWVRGPQLVRRPGRPRLPKGNLGEDIRDDDKQDNVDPEVRHSSKKCGRSQEKGSSR
ncbi:hypothetical protein HDK90DRAFT_462518 [Phyllosticta capitalensis]|uniref:Uncharacterized protein n=1 Tax=Phyllosticta capitalensis TaxID=121624 RepID=A0ABR1YY04_9PEZI